MPFIELNAIILAFLLINITIENVVISGWMGYLTWKFYQQSKVSNGITQAITVTFLALSIDRLWSIQISIVNAFVASRDVLLGDYPPVDTFRLLSLSERFLSLLAIIIAAYILSQRLRNENYKA